MTSDVTGKRKKSGVTDRSKTIVKNRVAFMGDPRIAVMKALAAEDRETLAAISGDASLYEKIDALKKKISGLYEEIGDLRSRLHGMPVRRSNGAEKRLLGIAALEMAVDGRDVAEIAACLGVEEPVAIARVCAGLNAVDAAVRRADRDADRDRLRAERADAVERAWQAAHDERVASYTSRAAERVREMEQKDPHRFAWLRARGFMDAYGNPTKAGLDYQLAVLKGEPVEAYEPPANAPTEGQS